MSDEYQTRAERNKNKKNQNFARADKQDKRDKKKTCLLYTSPSPRD